MSNRNHYVDFEKFGKLAKVLSDHLNYLQNHCSEIDFPAEKWKVVKLFKLRPMTPESDTRFIFSFAMRVALSYSPEKIQRIINQIAKYHSILADHHFGKGEYIERIKPIGPRIDRILDNKYLQIFKTKMNPWSPSWNNESYEYHYQMIAISIIFRGETYVLCDGPDYSDGTRWETLEYVGLNPQHISWQFAHNFEQIEKTKNNRNKANFKLTFF